MHTYIIGHLKPDTDSVVAAMALAKLCQNVSYFGYPNAQAAITQALNPETTFLFEKFKLPVPSILTASELADDDQVILVDHNEADQRLQGLNPNQIVGIVDHHKANINFEQPINLIFKTWGSSNTIVAFMMQQNDFTPDIKLASLMLAAILSDTVGFKSPTCTAKDKEMAHWLAALANIDDLAALSLEIFQAKSDISHLSAEEIVTNDYKIFIFAGKKVMIDQLETVEQDKVLAEKKALLLQTMSKVKTTLQVDLIYVVLTDILKVNSKLLLLDETAEKIAVKAFGGTAKEQVLDIGGRLSRKKEIAPPIEKALNLN